MDAVIHAKATTSKGESVNLELTPLGAAIVEAMPDRKKMKAIQKDFTEHKICPESDVFSGREVVAFYAERGEKVVACRRDGVKGKT